jgi:hypothetical protein
MFVHYGITIGANPIQTLPYPMPVTTQELNRQPFFISDKMLILAVLPPDVFRFEV